MSRAPFFATCAPGVEPVLHAEARSLRLARIERQVGGVYFEGEMSDARRANLWLRTAVRILMRVARFACPDEAALYAGAREVDWSRFLAPEGRLVVDAHSSLSRLDHTRYVEQRVKDAIVDRFRELTGARPSVDREEANLGVHVHLHRDRCTLLVDTSGRSLHRRGWRCEQGRAPLAETLAAAVILFSEWDERSPLLDPFCGSGTILIEAAMIAARIAPGLFRERFGFERWHEHDARAWEMEKARAREERIVPRRLILRGTDVDPVRIDEARANAESAGVAGLVELAVADASDFAPRKGWNAWVVSNLPYGQRVGRAQDLGPLYRRFGERLRGGCEGYHVALLARRGPLIAALGLEHAREIALVNGGIECRLCCARIGG